jgi:hypothetical protein
MRRLLQILCLCGVSVHAYAHEIETGVPAAIEMHALYHKVKASYPMVDILRLKTPPSHKPDIFSYYFDPATDSLYSCIGDNDSTVCSGPESSKNISWTKPESLYGHRNDLLPIDRLFHGPVYFLEGVTPFSQSTTYVYYSGRGKVIRCRKIFTEYNFEVDKNGEHLFFQNERKDEWTERCEQIYPRSQS